MFCKLMQGYIYEMKNVIFRLKFRFDEDTWRRWIYMLSGGLSSVMFSQMQVKKGFIEYMLQGIINQSKFFNKGFPLKFKFVNDFYI